VNYYTTTEAAAKLHLSNKTLRRRLIAGRIPGVRIGKRWTISIQAMAEILEAKANADELKAFWEANRDAVQGYCDENRATVAGY
jgi:excisionase family DNA binding protein